MQPPVQPLIVKKQLLFSVTNTTGGAMCVSAALHLAMLNTCPEPFWFSADGEGELSILGNLFLQVTPCAWAEWHYPGSVK